VGGGGLIDFASFHDLSIGFWKCSGGVVSLCNELCLGVQRVPGLMFCLVID